jgi:hypothetical protein
MTSRSRRPGQASVEFMINADPVRAAFQRRSLEALDRIASTAPIESLADALAASTDVGTLARALGDNAVVGAAVVSLEPLAPLIARNAEHRMELLEAAGGTLNAPEVALFLNVSRQAVDKRRRSQGLLALRQGGDWRYPRCQFNEAEHDVIADLPRFLKEAKISSPWVVLDLLLAPDDALNGKTPLEVLHTAGWTDALARILRIEHGDGFA